MHDTHTFNPSGGQSPTFPLDPRMLNQHRGGKLSIPMWDYIGLLGQHQCRHRYLTMI